MTKAIISSQNDMIFRRVKVNRSRTPQEAIIATGRKQQNVSHSVAAEMPRAKNDTVDVFFFKLDQDVTQKILEKEYELRGLNPADPYSLAAVNEADPAFADTYPNCTYWRNADNTRCCAIFDHCGGSRRAHIDYNPEEYLDAHNSSIYRSANDWSESWWFAGIRYSAEEYLAVYNSSICHPASSGWRNFCRFVGIGK